jgi:transposase
VLLLSFPGINVVSAAEFAGEMGPIENYPSDTAITGRAGLFPARYQSDKVDHCDGPLVRRANHVLRYTILLIAENLLRCNGYFRGLGQRWWAEGVDPRVQCVRVAKRFCRIAYHMVAGRQVFRHPSCRPRHKILEKLSNFYIEHKTPLDQVLRDFRAAADWIPAAEYAAEAEPFQQAMGPSTSSAQSAANRKPSHAGRNSKASPGPAIAKPEPRRAARSQDSSRCRSGPRLLSEILPELFARLGVTMIQSNPKGETDLT